MGKPSQRRPIGDLDCGIKYMGLNQKNKWKFLRAVYKENGEEKLGKALSWGCLVTS